MASEEQKALLLRNLIRLIERANAANDRADPALFAAAEEIARIVRNLPDGLLREQAWKAAQPQVLRALSAMSEAVGSEIINELGRMLPEQARWAAGYLNGQQELSYTPPWEGAQPITGSVSPFSSDAPGQAAANRATYGFNSGFLPRTSELVDGRARTFKPSDLWGAGRSPDQLAQMPLRVPDWVYRIVKQSRINGFTVQQYFGDSAVLREDLDMGRFIKGQGLGGVARTTLPDGRNVPRFAKFGYTSIDRNVRSGFLSGLTNEEIARNIIFDEVRGKMRLGTNAVRLKSDARAAARTMLADLSEKVHQAQWKEMSTWEWTGPDGDVHSGKIIQAWRWDASTDSRACISCSALDNQEVEERNQLPRIPLHVSCRCRVLPVTATELELRRSGEGLSKGSGMEYVTSIPPQKPNEPRAAYVRRMHDLGYGISPQSGPSGEKWFVRRTPTKADSVAEWAGELAKRNTPSDRITLQEYLGGNAAGSQRAEFLRRRIAAGEDPRTAVVNLSRKVEGSDLRTWKPVADLRREMPEIKQVEPILSKRQAAVAARMEAGLDERRAKRGLPPLTAEQRRFVRREAMATAPRRGQR